MKWIANLYRERRDGQMKPSPACSSVKTILLVDDDPDVVALVTTFLANANYNVLVAHAAEEALQRSRCFRDDIHFLISDYEMPGMNGIELAIQISLERP